MPRRINVEKYKADKVEEEGLILETADGTEFEIPPPLMWPDEMQAAALRRDVVGIAKGILGERYDEWIGKGGTAMLVSKIVEDELGAKVPES